MEWELNIQELGASNKVFNHFAGETILFDWVINHIHLILSQKHKDLVHVLIVSSLVFQSLQRIPTKCSEASFEYLIMF